MKVIYSILFVLLGITFFVTELQFSAVQTIPYSPYAYFIPYFIPYIIIMILINTKEKLEAA